MKVIMQKVNKIIELSKKKFNRILLILFFLLNIQLIQAQTEKTPPLKVPDMLQNADYVFEGTVVDTKGYWLKSENGDNIYTSLLVQVTNVFKGNGIKLGLIQIIVKGGWAQIPNSNMEEFQHFNPPFHGEQRVLITDKGVRGIFAGKAIPNNMGYQWDKKIENTILTEQTTTIIYCESCDVKYFAPWAGDFGNAKNLRKSIKSFNLKTDYTDRTDIIEDSLAVIQQQKDIQQQQEDNVKMSKTLEEAKACEALMIKGKELAKLEEESKKKTKPKSKSCRRRKSKL